MESSTGGQWNGDLAISEIDYNSITRNDHTDDIPVKFFNLDGNVAMSYPTGQCTTENITTTSGKGKEFYLKRSVQGDWEIHSKECPGLLVQLAGICQNKMAIQLSRLHIKIVKIQLEGRNYLNLREVEVYDYNDVNMARGKSANQSSTISPGQEAYRGVDGDLSTITHTKDEQGKHQFC
jgi:hypothetical protein